MALTRWIFVLLFAAGATALSAQTTYTVTSNADSGTGSLREAITMANSNAGDDTIDITATGTITLSTALPVISESVTIDGPGRTALTIERDNLASDFRLFESSTIGVFLRLYNMTLQGGRAVQGGGLFTRAATSLFDVRIVDCIANGGAGGGNAEGGAIYHASGGGALTLTNCLIENCQANGGDNTGGDGGGGYGGAIYLNTGSLGLLSTTINNCDANGGDSTGGNGAGGQGHGAGIYARYITTLTDSVVSNCTATAGLLNGTGGDTHAQGGGIYGTGTITSIDTTWQSNAASSPNGAGHGGGIFFWPSATQQLTVTRSVLTGNNSASASSSGFMPSHGAAIHSLGVVEIRESQISGSTATAEGSASRSAVFHNDNATFLVERSTINANSGTAFNIGSSSGADIINTTISGNTSGLGPGGISCFSTSIDLTFCTITLNTGATAGGVEPSSGNITLIGTIVAGNTGGSAADADVSAGGGAILDGGGNLIGVDDGALFTNGTTQTGTSGAPLDAQLQALADNGGLTMTHALTSSSPAVDMGGSVSVPGTDQRNATRNVGAADAGAYEFGATVPGGQGSAGGEGDERCSVSPGAGLPWLLLLGLIALLGTGLRARRA